MWRSDNIDYRNSLTFRATKNRNSSFKTCHNSYRTFRHIQWWVLVLEDDFEFTLATFTWWQPWTTSLLFVPMLIFNMATLEVALANNHRDLLVLMSPLEIALANILVMYSYYWMWRMSNKWCKMDFPYRFLCAFFITFLQLFHCRLFIWIQHCLGWKIFCLYF